MWERGDFLYCYYSSFNLAGSISAVQCKVNWIFEFPSSRECRCNCDIHEWIYFFIGWILIIKNYCQQRLLRSWPISESKVCITQPFHKNWSVFFSLFIFLIQKFKKIKINFFVALQLLWCVKFDCIAVSDKKDRGFFGGSTAQLAWPFPSIFLVLEQLCNLYSYRR